LRKYNNRTGKSIEGINAGVLDCLERHRWPGNVRELENVIERAVVLGRGREIEMGDLPATMHASRPVRREEGTPLADLPYRKAKEIAMGEFDRRYITELLTRTGGNVSRASRRAGMDRSNFRRVMKKHDFDPEAFAPDDAARAED